MYGWDILSGISKGTFEIPHKISYPYIERYDFYRTIKLQELLDLKAHKCFWNAPWSRSARGHHTLYQTSLVTRSGTMEPLTVSYHAKVPQVTYIHQANTANMPNFSFIKALDQIQEMYGYCFKSCHEYIDPGLIHLEMIIQNISSHSSCAQHRDNSNVVKSLQWWQNEHDGISNP